MNRIEEQINIILKDIKNEKNAENCILVAVTKTVSFEIVKIAYDAGLRNFGENRVDILAEKIMKLPSDIIWHFIGNIQSRKIQEVVKYSDFIHSVDSLDKIEKIEKYCSILNKKVRFLLQINVSQEETKSGFRIENIEEIYSAIILAKKCKTASVCGLMTMAPFSANSDDLLKIFSKLKNLRDELVNKFDLNLPELSMGMSNDYHEALKEKATMIRVGSQIFN